MIKALHLRALAGEPVLLETQSSEQGRLALRGSSCAACRCIPRGAARALHRRATSAAQARRKSALRASEEQYRAIFKAAADALVLRDAEARIVDVNPAFLE